MITEGRLLAVARRGSCPHCGAPNLIPSPKGGASQNFYCDACKTAWNFHGVGYGILGLERIGPPDKTILAMYRAKWLDGFKPPKT